MQVHPPLQGLLARNQPGPSTPAEAQLDQRICLTSPEPSKISSYVALCNYERAALCRPDCAVTCGVERRSLHSMCLATSYWATERVQQSRPPISLCWIPPGIVRCPQCLCKDACGAGLQIG